MTEEWKPDPKDVANYCHRLDALIAERKSLLTDEQRDLYVPGYICFMLKDIYDQLVKLNATRS